MSDPVHPGPRRRLAAIMFADMVGYTALMQTDEARARSRRDRFRSALDQAVRQHHGEILQHYGDGTLSVFGSAVEAVEAAVAVQASLREDPHLPARIGVHTGDIVQDAEGVYGDGVNVASRIESLAEPGGILVSGKVYDEIKNHPSLAAAPMGEVLLKNVSRLLSVFAITNEGLAIPTPEAVRVRSGSPGTGSESSEGAEDTRDAGSPGPGEKLLTALGERALIQWVLLYLVAAWAVLQAGSYAAAAFGWPPVVSQGLLVAAAVGLPVVVVVTWYHGQRGRQRVTGPEMLMIAVLLAIAGGLFSFLHSGARTDGFAWSAARPAELVGGQPSLAVLPFTNQSGTPETEPFAAGIHDDVLTQLSKIAGIKVISRTSVLGYRGTDKSVPQIAGELGVGAVLEGGIQRVNDRIRINAQLIDAETDTHLWAERFDTVYTVENVFAIQSAIAMAIAEALEAVLTQEERAGIDAVPTDDLEAYELYLSGLEYLTRPGWDRAELDRALEDFEGATRIDPGFALAYVHQSVMHFLYVRVGYDTSVERMERIRETAERSLQLDPGLPQGHQALSHYYYVTQQADRALAELAIAQRGLPSDPWIPVTRGMIRQRQGAWEQATADFERAVDLDPRNPELLFLAGDNYSKLRRWNDAERMHDRTLALAPGLPEALLMKALLAIDREGDPQPLLDVLESLPADVDPLGQGDFFRWWGHFLARNFEVSDSVMARAPGGPESWQGPYPVSVLRGLSLRLLGRPQAARRIVEAGLPAIEQRVRERPDEAAAHSALGLAYALLGRPQVAVREGVRATELIPVSRNAYDGPLPLTDLARIYALLGEAELAVEQLEALLSVPGDVTVSLLSIDPTWDGIREHPRFQALLEQ